MVYIHAAFFICPSVSAKPPRMRGKDGRELPPAINHGITPALAGKRRTRLRPSEKAGDHPRACGEKYAVNAPDGDVKGSPPHLRGKVGQGLRLAALPRITPAHTGKRNGRLQRPDRSRDHPRTCGEKNNLRQAFAVQQGSPPHMRGKVDDGRQNVKDFGITPAHAGKRRWSPPSGRRSKDHPRVCGEKSSSVPCT